MWPEDTRTNIRKSMDSLYILPKKLHCSPEVDWYYIATDPMRRTYATVLFSLAYGMWDVNFPNLEKSAVKKFLHIRGLPDVEGVELVDRGNSCFSNIEATVFVRALDKKRWERKEYDGVVILNLAREDDTRERKKVSLNNLRTRCEDEANFFGSSCRAPSFKRKIFGDTRDVNYIPGPFIDAMICTHVNIAGDYLHLFNNPSCASFGYFGLPENILRCSEAIVKDVVEYKLSIPFPDYRLNDMYRNFNRPMNSGLEETLFS